MIMKHATTAAVPSGTQPMRARTSPTNPSSPQIRRARPVRPNTSHTSCRLASRRLNAAGAQEEVVEEDAVAKEKRDIQKMLSKEYKYGFKTIIESDVRDVM